MSIYSMFFQEFHMNSPLIWYFHIIRCRFFFSVWVFQCGRTRERRMVCSQFFTSHQIGFYFNTFQFTPSPLYSSNRKLCVAPSLFFYLLAEVKCTLHTVQVPNPGPRKPPVLQVGLLISWLVKSGMSEAGGSPGPGVGTCAIEIHSLYIWIHHRSRSCRQVHTWIHSWHYITLNPLITYCTCFLFTHNQLHVLKALHSPPFFARFCHFFLLCNSMWCFVSCYSQSEYQVTFLVFFFSHFHCHYILNLSLCKE